MRKCENLSRRSGIKQPVLRFSGATGHGLASVFDEPFECPLPDKLKRLVERVQPLPARRAGLGECASRLRDLLYPVSAMGLAAASAAVLIAGIGVGSLIVRSGTGGGSIFCSPSLVADEERCQHSPLSRSRYALDTPSERKGNIDRFPGRAALKLAVKLSFQNQGHDYCRQYEIELPASQNYGGVACNSNGQWNIRFQTALAPTHNPPIRKRRPQATGAGNPWRQAVISMIDGDALGPGR